MRLMTMAAVLAGASGLAGCAQINLLTKALEYQGIESDIEDAEGVEVTMPEGGKGEYEGVVGISAGYEDGGVLMFGDAALTADFDAATIDGVLDDFIAAEFDDDTDLEAFLQNPVASAFKFESATGKFDLTNGVIVADGFTVDIDGSVAVDANVYTADGRLIGEFLGANAELLKAWADARNISFTRNGVNGTDIDVELVAGEK